MAKTVLCVLCRRHPVDVAWRPFCSERCKLQDLAHWAGGRYRVPGERLPEAGTGDSDDSDEHEGPR